MTEFKGNSALFLGDLYGRKCIVLNYILLINSDQQKNEEEITFSTLPLHQFS